MSLDLQYLVLFLVFVVFFSSIGYAHWRARRLGYDRGPEKDIEAFCLFCLLSSLIAIGLTVFASV